MAGDSLIERYLAELDLRLANRQDRSDLIDEVADHLYSAAERGVAAGVDRPEAERRALQKFGRTDLVASLVTTIPAESAREAVFLSRHVAAFAAATAVLWLGVGVVGLYGRIRFRGFYWPDDMALTAAVAIALAVLSTTVTLVALNVRAVGGVDDVARAIGLIGIVASFVAFAFSWFATLWVSILTLVVVWTLARTWRTRVGSRAATLVMMVVLIGIATATVVMPIVSAVVGGIRSDPVVLAVFFTGVGVLAAGFAHIAVRTAYRASRFGAVAA